MSRLRAGLWWGLALAALPLVLPLAIHTRRTALRLPPAGGEQSGLAGAELAGEPLRLLLVGESTVAGVGVEAQEVALAGQLARALALREGRPVAWRACGENGITAAEAGERLLPVALAEPADLVLLVFGVNDTTHLSSLARWEDSLRSLSRALSERGGKVVFTGVPPIQHFSALPWLLRQLLGRRAALLDAALRRVSAEERAEYAPVALRFSPDYLARDGYHPSALGYRVWAEHLAERLGGLR
ncbi:MULTISPECIES: SGNH/GDSL hydrolase family protein [unclassified Pseudomonas]|uniref:SGNH/GDSL hydrolase family protein n=1 Tax=unclassified Pseudomonas TaxID=196821 RepID=UPI00244A1966|nr:MULTISPECIES: SGNH/GDSL hydrolase family protein [unclassified Pseudomonas]MDG9928152.1 SGNH/GDSL hydrolase family protein [Pseudomonas sp. GD04042]MDH0481284.1 SGNH/GDSL hydrolase family protein [Pseudomonas sp. GD04015]MDH0605191.1 SGNH/GDSL hydrolase family protein [Pseudomonas sp. GD03869]